MEKVFQIHLAGMLFTIEEVAYQQLKTYLDKLHIHFAGNSEIVQDIEARMAELFARRVGSAKVTLLVIDVQEVTAILGNIDQMDAHGDKQEMAEPKAPINKPLHHKLRRNPDDQNLGGVCS
ncbi:MAG: hypothetical protein ACOVK9_08370, partial [Bacteroidia bacterium]